VFVIKIWESVHLLMLETHKVSQARSTS